VRKLRCPWLLTTGAICFLVLLAADASAQSPPSKSAQAEALVAESRKLAGGGQHRDALAKLDAASALVNPRTEVRLAATIEFRRVFSLRALGDRVAAVPAAERARTMAARAGDDALLVDTILQLAQLRNDGGDVDGAIEVLEAGRVVAERMTNEIGLVAVLEAQGRFRHIQGRAAETVELCTRAVTIADRLNHTGFSVSSRTIRSNGFLALGRFDEALADAERAYEVARTAGPGVQAGAIFTLAQAHAHIWNLDRAEGLWNEAIEIYRRLGSKGGIGLSFRQRMDTRFALRNYDDAARDGEEAVRVLETTAPYMMPGLLARLALIEARREKLDAARAYAARAAALKVAPGTSRFVRNDLGLVALALSDSASADAHFRIVLEVSRSIPDPEYVWRAEYGLGRTALLRGDAVLATTLLSEAVAGIERMRRALPDAAMRAAFLSDRTIAHEALIEALAAQSTNPGDEFAVRALGIAEMARGRSLADLLAEADRVPHEPALQKIRDTETSYGRRLSDVQKRVAAAQSDAERAAALQDLDTAEREFESLVASLRRDHPSYASLRYPQPLSIERIQSLLHEDEALIEFATGERSGFGWVVRRSGIAMFTVPPRPALDPAVRLMEAVAASDDREAIRAAGQRLGELVLGPAIERLDGARRLVIVPDGPLHRLPFASLRIRRDRWLVEEFAIAIAPSATVLGELRGRPLTAAAKPLIAFAASADNPAAARLSPAARNPGRPLQHADQEVEDAIRLLDAGETSKGRTESAVKTLATEPVRIVHFAAHAIADEAVPRRSGVLLEADERDDGWLQVHEIPNISMRADLVVLATCRSHAGRSVRGEGLLGLSRAFMRAGARAVVATLWEVDDRDTRRLVSAFYDQLRSGSGADEALRIAQLRMIREGGQAASPKVWASFIVTGDASPPLFEARPPSTAGTIVAAAIVLACAAAGVLIAGRRRGVRSPDTEAAGR
jgi:CHAT domain-containing protein